MRSTKTKLGNGRTENKDAGLDLGLLQDRVSFHVRRLSRRIGRQYSEETAAISAKPGAFTALALIAANEGLSQTALAREMGFDKATIVALVDSLEEQGWAVRARAAGDRRRHSLALTRAGEAALKRLRVMASVTEDPIQRALSPADLRKLIELLDRAYVSLTPRG